MNFAVEHADALVDQEHLAAEGFHLIHEVRRQHDRGSALRRFLHDLDNEAPVHRIETTEGLVHDDEVGFVKQGAAATG